MSKLRRVGAVIAVVMCLWGASAAPAANTVSPGGTIVYPETKKDPTLGTTGGLSIDRDVGAGESDVPLTTDPSQTEPAFSPDGSLIAIARTGAAPADAGIATIAVDGGELRQLTDHPYDAAPTFSPDGSLIAFARAGAIYVMGADGYGLHQVTEDRRGADGQPTFTPDGTRIVFTRTYLPKGNRRRTSGLYSVPVEGGPVTTFIDGEAPESEATFSPNGKRLAYAADGLLVLARADGTHRRRLPFGGERASVEAPAFSPDSRYLACLVVGVGNPGLEYSLSVVSLDSKPKGVETVVEGGSEADSSVYLGAPTWGP